MAIAEFHFSANNSLQRMYSAMVIVPEKQTGPYPVLYLLHGQSDDHTAWTRRANIDLYVQDLPLIVVMPDTERGWYVDALSDPSKRFESLIIDDLIPFVDDTFQTKPAREGRALMGLSMGGYGALSLALKHQDLFCAAHGFSSGFERGRQDLTDEPEFRLIFGERPAGTDYDVFALAAKADKAAMPQITFDCGVDDFTIDANRDLHRRMTDLGLPHTYTEYPGAHDWAYWNEHFLDALPPVLSALGIEADFDPSKYFKDRNAPISVNPPVNR